MGDLRPLYPAAARYIWRVGALAEHLRAGCCLSRIRSGPVI
jgi:hypothetical protein